LSIFKQFAVSGGRGVKLSDLCFWR